MFLQQKNCTAISVFQYLHAKIVPEKELLKDPIHQNPIHPSPVPPPQSTCVYVETLYTERVHVLVGDQVVAYGVTVARKPFRLRFDAPAVMVEELMV